MNHNEKSFNNDGYEEILLGYYNQVNKKLYNGTRIEQGAHSSSNIENCAQV